MRGIVANIFKLVLIIIIMQATFTTTCQAFSLGDIFTKGNDFINEGSQAANQDGAVDNVKFSQGVGDLYGIIFVVGVVIAVIVGGILGIKFIIGSVEEQAKVKETLIPYVLGCIVIFGGLGIWRIVVTVLSGITS